MRVDTLFRFLLQGGVGGVKSQSNANKVKERVVPVPHSSTQNFREIFFALGRSTGLRQN